MSKDPLFTVFDSTELERDLALIDRVREKFTLPSDKEVADCRTEQGRRAESAALADCLAAPSCF